MDHDSYSLIQSLIIFKAMYNLLMKRKQGFGFWDYVMFSFHSFEPKLLL